MDLGVGDAATVVDDGVDESGAGLRVVVSLAVCLGWPPVSFCLVGGSCAGGRFADRAETDRAEIPHVFADQERTHLDGAAPVAKAETRPAWPRGTRRRPTPTVRTKNGGLPRVWWTPHLRGFGLSPSFLAGDGDSYIAHDPGGTPIAIRASTGQLHYYAEDGLGSTIALVNQDGAQTADYVYDPSGEVTVTNPPPAATPNASTPSATPAAPTTSPPTSSSSASAGTTPTPAASPSKTPSKPSPTPPAPTDTSTPMATR
jgi:hypothetical protein